MLSARLQRWSSDTTEFSMPNRRSNCPDSDSAEHPALYKRCPDGTLPEAVYDKNLKMGKSPRIFLDFWLGILSNAL